MYIYIYYNLMPLDSIGVLVTSRWKELNSMESDP